MSDEREIDETIAALAEIDKAEREAAMSDTEPNRDWAEEEPFELKGARTEEIVAEAQRRATKPTEPKGDWADEEAHRLRAMAAASQTQRHLNHLESETRRVLRAAEARGAAREREELAALAYDWGQERLAEAIRSGARSHAEHKP